MACYVRIMREEDVDQVTEIDREAFPTMWPPANFRREIKNRLSHYMVVCDDEMPLKTPDIITRNGSGFSRLISGLRRLFLPGQSLAGVQSPIMWHYVVGFVGLWVMADEAHITSIAVREDYRRRGIGELLMIAAIDTAESLKARIVTLEVRVSNSGAQNLYYRYGFSRAGIRKGYYTDNREDAVIMSTDSITSDSYKTEFNRLKKEFSQKIGKPLAKVHR